jgi:mannose-6-phosphate isomerase-like protein (cupin superfamily)
MTQLIDSADCLTLQNRHTGEMLQLRRSRRDGELCLELKGSVPPRGQGPPLHIHFKEDEELSVVTGVLGVEVDGRVIEVGVGETASVPMGSAHRWWNASDKTLVVQGFARPVFDLDEYLAGAFDVLNSGAANRPSVFYMAHLVWRYRKTQAVLFAPLWLQTLLVPTILLLGTLLGRYRGTDWPGSPNKKC